MYPGKKYLVCPDQQVSNILVSYSHITYLVSKHLVNMCFLTIIFPLILIPIDPQMVRIKQLHVFSIHKSSLKVHTCHGNGSLAHCVDCWASHQVLPQSGRFMKTLPTVSLDMTLAKMLLWLNALPFSVGMKPGFFKDITFEIPRGKK